MWTLRRRPFEISFFGSSGVDGKRFLESNASSIRGTYFRNAYSIRGTYFRLGYVKVPPIEDAFDSRNLLPSTALDPNFLLQNTINTLYLYNDFRELINKFWLYKDFLINTYSRLRIRVICWYFWQKFAKPNLIFLGVYI